jgi:hypothetical protein
MDSVEILNRIISKGGLIGATAKFCVGDEQKRNQFLLECSEQCHNSLILKIWGEKLVFDIIKYCINNKTGILPTASSR